MESLWHWKHWHWQQRWYEAATGAQCRVWEWFSILQNNEKENGRNRMISEVLSPRTNYKRKYWHLWLPGGLCNNHSVTSDKLAFRQHNRPPVTCDVAYVKEFTVGRVTGHSRLWSILAAVLKCHAEIGWTISRSGTVRQTDGNLNHCLTSRQTQGRRNSHTWFSELVICLRKIYFTQY